jgi:hypothetical protein
MPRVRIFANEVWRTSTIDYSTISAPVFQGFATRSTKQVLRSRSLNMDQETTLSASGKEANRKGPTQE